MRSQVFGVVLTLALLPFVAVASDTHNHGEHSDHSGHGDHSNHSDHSDHGEHKADVHKLGSLKIKAAWTRATVKTAKVAGGYVTIKNTGAHADRLVGGATEISNSLQIHEMKLVDDIMRMRPLEAGVEILPGEEVVLKPGAQHLMFMGLQEQLQEGNTVNVTLVFEKAGEITIPFAVNSLAAKSAHEGHNH